MASHCSRLSVLLPVDGSPNSDRAVQLLIDLYEKLAPVAVRVLHVRVPAVIADTGLSGQGAGEGNPGDEGEGALRSAQKLLEDAGIPYVSEVRRGYVAQEIARYAKDFDCSAIIMGTRGMGTTNQIFGSIVRQVVAATSVPVTLVR